MKGIVLAGGNGTRLHPITKAISKQLLPIYDKPLIYYPISVLMLAGIREILIITTPHDMPQYKTLLGSGENIGVDFHYIVQEKPNGLAEAFILGKDFIGNNNVSLVLGDNLFHGHALTEILNSAKTTIEQKNGALIFGYPVHDPRAFGVVEFNEKNHVISIEEKPKHPKSNFAVPGLYFYDNQVSDIAAEIEPSARGELEITSINNVYLQKDELRVVTMGRGLAWLDTGTPEGILKASEYVEAVQQRQGFYIACLEEIAYRRGFIDEKALLKSGKELAKTSYGKYLISVAKGNKNWA